MARFLFVVPPLAGHVNPTISVGRSLLARGHQVAWAGHAGIIRAWLPENAELLPTEEGVSADLVKHLLRVRARGLESMRFLFDDFLLPMARATLPSLEAAVDRFQPTVMVVDQQAFAGGVVARKRRVPWASFATTSALLADPVPALPKVREWIAGRLAALDAEAGLPPGTEYALSPYLVVVFSTAALTGPVDLPPHFQLVGPSIGDRPDATPFPWEWLRDVPCVLVSVGTVNLERGAPFFRTVIEALGNQSYQVVVVAPPESLGALPDNMLAQARIPQLALLPRMQAVVCHGGHNTVCESLAHGIPLVVAPIKDDQTVIAWQVVNAGAGLRVKFGRVSAPDLRAAVETILREPGYREAAGRIRESFAAAGGAPRAAQLLEDLATGAK